MGTMKPAPGLDGVQAAAGQLHVQVDLLAQAVALSLVVGEEEARAEPLDGGGHHDDYGPGRLLDSLDHNPAGRDGAVRLAERAAFQVRQIERVEVLLGQRPAGAAVGADDEPVHD